MTLLMLGGTAEARRLATHLHRRDYDLIYSIAGLVRKPELNCAVITGGFTQFGGLVNYIRGHEISAILDVTHPYAENISRQAFEAATINQIPCWRYTRPLWQAGEGDDWHEVDNWASLLPLLSGHRSTFFTAGKLDESQINQLGALAIGQVIIRTAMKPVFALPGYISWIEAIGPFDYDSELALLERYQVDSLVCKHSGGDATKAKLVAARQLGISVFMYKRPTMTDADEHFDSMNGLINHVIQNCTPRIARCHLNTI